MAKQRIKSEFKRYRSPQPAASVRTLPPWFGRAVFWALLLVIATVAWCMTLDAARHPFKRVVVDASYQHVERAMLQGVIDQQLHGSGFFSVNMHQVSHAVSVLPWVASVSVRRFWPSTLEVIVTEQQPLARWGQNAVINQQGQLFYPPVDTIPASLAQLRGPKGSEPTLLAQYQLVTAQLLPLQLTVQKLILTERMAWQMTLSNGIVVMLGRQDVLARLKQLVNLYPRLVGHGAKRVVKIDLRYPNGLAVQWMAGARIKRS